MSSNPPTKRPRNPSRAQTTNHVAIPGYSDSPTALVNPYDAAAPSSSSSASTMSFKRKPDNSLDASLSKTAGPRKSHDNILTTQGTSVCFRADPVFDLLDHFQLLLLFQSQDLVPRSLSRPKVCRGLRSFILSSHQAC